MARRMTRASAGHAELRALGEAMDRNLGQQEDVLFPAIRLCEETLSAGLPLPIRAVSSIRDLIPKMRQDQQQLLSLLSTVRQKAGADEPPGLKNLEAELRVHVQLEDNILFQRALQLLSPGD